MHESSLIAGNNLRQLGNKIHVLFIQLPANQYGVVLTPCSMLPYPGWGKVFCWLVHCTFWFPKSTLEMQALDFHLYNKSSSLLSCVAKQYMAYMLHGMGYLLSEIDYNPLDWRRRRWHSNIQMTFWRGGDTDGKANSASRRCMRKALPGKGWLQQPPRDACPMPCQGGPIEVTGATAGDV